MRAAMTTTPDREITQISSAGNVELVRTLRSQILELEIKRSDMLQKFTAQYPPVVQMQDDLARLRQALISAEQTPLRDETTNQNPTHQWLRNEAARVKTEHDALRARANAIRRTVADYRARARRLDAQSVEQQQLLSAAKEAEDNYQLYRRKQEEARISDALDHTRIANVVVVDPPTVPQSSQSPRRLILLLGGLAAVVAESGRCVSSERARPALPHIPRGLPGAGRAGAGGPSWQQRAASDVTGSRRRRPPHFHDAPDSTGGCEPADELASPGRRRDPAARTAFAVTGAIDDPQSRRTVSSRGTLSRRGLPLDGSGQPHAPPTSVDSSSRTASSRQSHAPPPLRTKPGRIEPATASPIAGFSAEMRQQLVGLVERVFMPLSGQPTRCVGFSAIDADGASGAITASVAELLSERTTGTVCVVDAHFASPSLHRYFGVANSAGLADALAVGAAPADSARRLRENLWIVTAGVEQPRADASADAMRLQMAKFIAEFDYVLVNIEPVAARGDAGRFAAVIDGVILVVDAESARREAGRRVVEILRAAGATVIGAVLTNMRLPIPERIYRRL